MQVITWEQLVEWFHFYQLEPFGEERADLRNGIACALLANVNRDPKKGKPYAPVDFMPFAEKPKADAGSGFMSFVASIKTNLKVTKIEGSTA